MRPAITSTTAPSDSDLQQSQALAHEATAYLLERHSAAGNRVGWMMTW
jgi:hypothetical protein